MFAKTNQIWLLWHLNSVIKLNLAKFILIFGCSSAFCKKIVQILMAGENKKISKFGGDIEISKSYFKGKRGKKGKTIFSIFKKDGKVYTKIVKKCFIGV